MRETCYFCDKPPRSRFATFCEAHFVGGKPSKVEYAVAAAVKRGDLRPVRECVCVDCGKPARHYDHRDYNKPLDVQPVCAACNFRRGPAERWKAA